MANFEEILSALRTIAERDDDEGRKARRALAAVRVAEECGSTRGAPTQRDILLLAATADCDMRTSARALRFGMKGLRGRSAERIVRAVAVLGMTLPTDAVAA